MATRDDELRSVEAALTAARRGGASVSQLAHAHEAAEKYGLHQCVAELRWHIRRVIPEPGYGHIPITRALALGVVSGVVCHLILGVAFNRNALVGQTRGMRKGRDLL